MENERKRNMVSKSSIENASGGRAWKTASMKGYVKKTALDAATYGTGAYKLTFVKAAGTEYDFYFNVDTSVYTSAIPNAANLTLDAELLGHMLTESWQAGTAADYETARSGGGTW